MTSTLECLETQAKTQLLIYFVNQLLPRWSSPREMAPLCHSGPPPSSCPYSFSLLASDSSTSAVKLPAEPLPKATPCSSRTSTTRRQAPGHLPQRLPRQLCWCFSSGFILLKLDDFLKNEYHIMSQVWCEAPNVMVSQHSAVWNPHPPTSPAPPASPTCSGSCL